MLGSSAMLAIAPRPAAILGGFVLVPVASLMAAWRLCRRRPLGTGDFRAWLACRELLARRGRLAPDRAPIYGDAELARLLGISPRRARASIRRLVGSGLLLWSEADIGFPEPAAGPAGPAEEVLADSIGSARGALAIPRRLLRVLAQGARPALIATSLGALLRCLSRRKAGFDGRGRFKASWVAKAFGVDKRAVKAARAELVELRWLTPEGSGQVAMNRWGKVYRIDLAWSRAGTRAGAQSPPPRAADGAQSPPPDLHQEPLSGMGRNQEPAPGGPAGVEDRRMDGCKKPAPAPTEAGRRVGPPPAVPSPRLEDVRPEDLADAGRLLELHRQAAGRGLVGASEADRLKFAAAAKHARTVGRENPCGLFARIVARGWWHFATLGEEECAARWLREHGRGGMAGRPGPPRRLDAGPIPSALSSLGEVLGRLGLGGRSGPAEVGSPGRGMTVAPVAAVAMREPSVVAGKVDHDTDHSGIGGRGEREMLARLRRLMGGAGSGM